MTEINIQVPEFISNAVSAVLSTPDLIGYFVVGLEGADGSEIRFEVNHGFSTRLSADQFAALLEMQADSIRRGENPSYATPAQARANRVDTLVVSEDF